MWEAIFSMTFTLFLLMDPIGNIPLFLSALKNTPPERYRWVICRELTIALCTIVSFYFIGEGLLDLLSVQQYTVQIAGGLILFIIALKMIFPSVHNSGALPNAYKEPFIVPLAIPLIAGPAVLAAVILYSHHAINTFISVTAIFLAWLGTTLILLVSRVLDRLLGEKGIIAIERLMGLLLTLISVQMLLEGLGTFFTAVP